MKKTLIFCTLLLTNAYFLLAQNKTEKPLLKFEPFWGGYSYTLYSKQYGYPNDITGSLFFFKPRLSLFLTKNLELGVSATWLKTKSNDTSILKPGKARALGYFIRYNLPMLNFVDSVRIYSKRFTIEGKPFIEFDHEYSSYGVDSLEKYIYSPTLRFRRFDIKGGVNFTLYKALYLSLFAIYNISPDFQTHKRGLGINFTLGYTINKRKS